MVRAVVFSAALLAPSTALAHATLIASQPAANAHLTESPATIHLTFSEEVVPRLCQIRIVSANGQKIELSVVGDPHNVRAVSGAPTQLEPGSYVIEWRVLSADGHPAEGSFEFSVGSPAVKDSRDQPVAVNPAPVTSLARTDSINKSGARIAGAPAFLAALRGAAMASLLGACGLLLLAMRGRESHDAQPYARRYCSLLTGAAAVFFLGHFIGWLVHTAPDQKLTTDWAAAVIGTLPGKIEAIRTALVLLAAWALLVARRSGLAGGFAVAAVAASAAAGHSAAVSPLFSIPLKAVHLIAVSLWFGGLLWLVLSPPSNLECRGIARRVSGVALSCVLIISISGIAQALLIAPLSALITSSYGLVLGVKTLLFLLLIGFGGFNRFRLLPNIESEDCRVRLRSSARRESAVMVLVLLIAGLLAYVPTPHSNTQMTVTQTESYRQ
jgi:copper transport protein